MPNDEELVDLMLLAEEWQREGKCFTISDLCPDRPDLWPTLEETLAGVGSLGKQMHVAEASGDEAGARPPTSSDAGQSIALPPIPGFEMIKEIGRGGMGVVYLARQLSLNRSIALKAFASNSFAAESSRVRFCSEAETIARLRHPNIVQIYEVGEAAGVPYYCMEYLEGGNLAQRVAGRPQPPRAAAQLVETLARAVHAAHLQGIVHRDLKPANILTTADGTPKISDFGLAKRMEEELAMTRSQVLGTPSYMAPEQVRPTSSTVGPPADIYALGVLLYEILTGRVPHAGENSVETVLLVLEREPVPPSQLVSKVSIDLETICLKCLAKKPSQRYATAIDLADDLRRWQNKEPILARPIGPLGRLTRWCQRRPAISALLGTVIIAVLSGLATTTWQWQNASAAGRRAEKEKITANNERAKAIGLADDLRIQRDAAEWQAYRSSMAAAASSLQLNQVRTARRHLQAAPEKYHNWEYRHFKRQIDGSLGVLSGHSAAVIALDISADSKLIASGAWDKTARIWDAQTGALLHVLDGHRGEVQPVAFSPDSQLLATASDDDAIRLWDVKTGRIQAEFRGLEGQVIVLAFSPDSSRVMAGTVKGNIRLWHTRKEGGMVNVGDKQFKVRALALSPDAKRFVATTADASLRIFNADTGEAMETWTGHRTPPVIGAFSPDGSRFASCAADGLRLWDAQTGKTIAFLPGHRRLVTSLTFNADGSRLVSSGLDPTAWLWDGRTGTVVAELRGHGSYLSKVAFSPDGSRILTSSDDHTTRMWSAANGELLSVLRGHSAHVWSSLFSPDGKRIITASSDETLRIWDAALAQSDGVLRGHDSHVMDVTFTADGRQIVSLDLNGSIRVWDADSEETVKKLKGGPVQFNSLSFNKEGTRLLVCGPRFEGVFLFDYPLAATPVPVGLRLPQGYVCAMHAEQSPAGDLIAVVSEQNESSGVVFLLSIASKEVVGTLREPGSVPYALTFSPTGKHLVVTDKTGGVSVWDVQTQRTIATHRPHRALVYGAAFDRTGKTLATAGVDGSVRLWDGRTYEPIADLVHGTGVTCVSFSADGARLASGCIDGTVRLWSLDTREELADLRGHSESVRAIAFSPDGTRLVSAGDNTVRIWSTLPRPRLDGAKAVPPPQTKPSQK